jgi:membrane protease YdiL (CAAX protease family)
MEETSRQPEAPGTWWGKPGQLLLALVLAMTFPTLITYLYFIALVPSSGAREVSRAQQGVYTVGKILQFTWPVLYLFLVTGQIPHPGRPRWGGLALGLVFGLAVVAVMMALYFLALRDSSLLTQTPEQIRQKLIQVGMASPGRYLALAVFVTVLHSLLEEYYWRWFVFGGLRRLLSLWPALVLSSLAFMAHHVIVLHVYLPGEFLAGVVPFSLGIAVGGSVWAWLYEVSGDQGSIYAPWLSHLLVDAGIFVIGWDLIQQG